MSLIDKWGKWLKLNVFGPTRPRSEVPWSGKEVHPDQIDIGNMPPPLDMPPQLPNRAAMHFDGRQMIYDAPPPPPTGSTEAVLAAWAISQPLGQLDDLKAFAKSHGKEWTDVGIQTRFLLYHYERAREIQDNHQVGHDSSDEPHLEPLHQEFLLTIDYLLDRGYFSFVEKMRCDLVGLWHEDKVARGLELHEALGMTEDQYSQWVECKDDSHGQ